MKQFDQRHQNSNTQFNVAGNLILSNNKQIIYYIIISIISILISYILLIYNNSISNNHFIYYNTNKILTIMLSILLGIILTFFIISIVFQSFRNKLLSYTCKTKYLSIIFIIFINLISVFSSYQVFSTEFIYIRSNADAHLTDISDNNEKNIGILIKDNLTKIRVKKGFHKFIFSHSNQYILKEIDANQESNTIIELKFDDIIIEKLERKNDDSVLLAESNDNDLKKLFKQKHKIDNYSKSKSGDSVIAQIIKFELSEKYSLYIEETTNYMSKYTISSNKRTFFPVDNNQILFKNTDYLDFINITDKIARNDTLSTIEKAFLEKAKPVFLITIKNDNKSTILLTNIMLKVISLDRVLGGGTKCLRPEVMYEIEVPTEIGEYNFPIRTNQLQIEEYGQFYLGLNSTNKRILENGSILYPQILYKIEIYFVFEEKGRTNPIRFEVLL